MKKLIVVILAFLYLAASTGATIHLHYCMGKLVEWGLKHDSKKKDKCNNCGMNNSTDKKGCCEDEQIQIKLSGDQKTVNNYQIISENFNTIVTPFFELPQIYISSITEKTPLNHAPPPDFGSPLYIQNCIFRI